MNSERASEAHDHVFNEVAYPDVVSSERLSLDDLEGVRLNVTADLGRARLTVREVLDLREGSIVQLDKLAGEMTDIHINSVPVARGEVVVIADALHVRIADIFGLAQDERDAGHD